MLDDITRDRIRSEIEQIDEQLVEFAALLDRSATREPNVVERAALGSVLHSFYTGLEGIFLAVAKRVDDHVPTGERWHMDLLDQVASSTQTRGAVISARTKQTLTQYLAFRHFFRHAYAHVFHWAEMRDLVEQLRSAWAEVRAEIEVFVGDDG